MQTVHDRIPSSGLRVGHRAHVPSARGHVQRAAQRRHAADRLHPNDGLQLGVQHDGRHGGQHDDRRAADFWTPIDRVHTDQAEKAGRPQGHRRQTEVGGPARALMSCSYLQLRLDN